MNRSKGSLIRRGRVPFNILSDEEVDVVSHTDACIRMKIQDAQGPKPSKNELGWFLLRAFLGNVLKEIIPKDLAIVDIVAGENTPYKFQQFKTHIIDASGSAGETADDIVAHVLPHGGQLVLLEFADALNLLLVSHLIESRCDAGH